MPPRTVALLMAAGSGTRFGGESPKVYARLGDSTVLEHTARALASHPGIDAVRVVIRREDHPIYRKLDLPSAYPCVIGGAARQDSARLGLESIAHHAPERVLIHDAARPMVSHALISRVLEALEHSQAVLPALQANDTVRQKNAHGGMELIARESLLMAQTPQGFCYRDIFDAHQRFRDTTVTDDIALAEMAGLTVSVVEGERLNLKITTQEDLQLMEKLAGSHFETRVGMGTDVHAFAPHDAEAPPTQRVLTLCGVKVPHTMRLHGHSDADIGLHALVDGILGAISAGDIGQHFRDDDPKWAGADSSRFLIHAYQLLKAKQGEIVHIDITFIGEQPKISPYSKQMAAQIADLLKLSLDRVNIKATTTEKLGFLGRSEGMAAQAVVTVRLPC